jgi:hypothetical protein
MVTRLTVDLFRPVPQEPLEVATRTARQGGRIQVIDATIIAAGVEVARASGMLLRASPIDLGESHRPAPLMHPGPLGIPTEALTTFTRGGGVDPETRPMRPGFHSIVETRGVFFDPVHAHRAAWLRMPIPLVEGEENTPLVRAASLSDFASGLGMVRLPDDTGFINTDITLYLSRMPEGEWICIDSQGSAQPSGICLGEAQVMDPHGVIGRIVVARIANSRKP